MLLRAISMVMVVVVGVVAALCAVVMVALCAAVMVLVGMCLVAVTAMATLVALLLSPQPIRPPHLAVVAMALEVVAVTV